MLTPGPMLTLAGTTDSTTADGCTPGTTAGEGFSKAATRA